MNNTACETGVLRNLYVSVGYALIGGVFTSLYVPCLIVICRQPLIKESCYKIMAAMGFMDLISLCAACFVPSILSAIGNPGCVRWSYWSHRISGAVGSMMWFMYAMTCVLLAMNRLVAMFSADKAKKLFTTVSVVWLVYALFGQLACVSMTFQRTLLFSLLLVNVAVGVFMFAANMCTDKALIYSPIEGVYAFEAGLLGINQMVDYWIGISLVVIYALIIVKLYKKTSVASDPEAANLAKMERSVTIQSIVLCSLTATTAWGYIFLPQLEAPVFSPLMNVFWQSAHGANALIYLTLNKTIQRGVKNMFGMNAVVGHQALVNPNKKSAAENAVATK